MSKFHISVIIATYNQPEWLKKVLCGYAVQNYSNFEVIIADDGSDHRTKETISKITKNFPFNVLHLWHEDSGYRRQTILNRAIKSSNGNYIIFTDGDCIPKNDFVRRHATYAEKGKFLSGGYCKLDMTLSQLIYEEDIISGNCFNVSWLKSKGKIGASQNRKLASGEIVSKFLDTITTSNASFNNCNSSAWKEDLLQINGYDERMLYGGPDRELGERLENIGIFGKQIRHRALCLHLDHPRPYKTKESLAKNLAIRKATKNEKKVWTEYGIMKTSIPYV